ncbi:bacterial proteasome activator family protein [Kitasatospora nipponensis]|uniref:Bacterial proteasome activator n=1 Tax=Kitasatospora nipponensis TaxID=258049 RepID=A0ABP4HMS5_9ACTN
MTKPLNERPEHEPYQGSTRSDGPREDGPQQVLIVGPDGMAVGTGPGTTGRVFTRSGEDGEPRELPVTEMVEQPAKVMRIGSMIKQLLEEVRAAPLDEASRVRLKDIHASSIKELELGLAPELVEELERLSLPFTEDTIPTEAELRIAQAQLVGWLEGLFHGIQTALFAQQMAARAQLEQMRRALPPGSQLAEHEFEEPGEGRGLRSGPYL